MSRPSISSRPSLPSPSVEEIGLRRSSVKSPTPHSQSLPQSSSGSKRQEEAARLSAKVSSGSTRQEEAARLSAKVSSGSNRQEEAARLSANASSGSTRQEESARLSAKASSGSNRQEEARLSAKGSSGSTRQEESARLSAKASSGSNRQEEARLSAKASSGSNRQEEARLSAKASSGSNRQEEARLSAKVSSGSTRQEEEARLSAKASSGSNLQIETARSATTENPLILNEGIIRYNHRQCVSYETPIIFGSRSRAPYYGVKGYRPSYFYFDPVLGTLAVGTDVDQGWDNLGTNSLITGLGNQATLPNSFVSGTNNKIFDLNKSAVGSNAILGGSDNSIAMNPILGVPQNGSAIIGSKNVHVSDCYNSVFLGLELSPAVSPFKFLHNTTVTSDLYALRKHVIGPIRSGKGVEIILPTANLAKGNHLSLDASAANSYLLEPTLIDANGDALFEQVAYAKTALYGGDVYAIGPKPANPREPYPGGGFFGKTLAVQTAIVGNTVASATTAIDVTLVINKDTSNGTTNVAPLTRNVTIILDSTSGPFLDGQTLSFKDITQVFQPNTAFNVTITVNNGVYIETYDAENQLVQVANGTYTLGTTGGAVSLRYIAAPLPGAHATWIIETQFNGRARLLA